MAVSMFDLEWEGGSVCATFVLIALVTGGYVGYVGGKAGWSRAKTVCTAVLRSTLFIIATSVVVAAVSALIELRKTPKQSNYIEWSDKHGILGLKLDEESWWNDMSCDCDMCFWDWTEPRPSAVVLHAMGHGTVIAFLAPVFCLIGAVPASMVASITFAVGAGRRQVEVWRWMMQSTILTAGQGVTNHVQPQGNRSR